MNEHDTSKVIDMAPGREDPSEAPTTMFARIILFGDIAVAERMITTDQLSDALLFQAAKEPQLIGEILIRKGHLTQEQVHKILETQRRRLKDIDGSSLRSLQDALFGKLLVQFGLASEPQVNIGLREQGLRRSSDDRIPLGEILIEHGVLTNVQVLSVLHKQKKEVLFCPDCYVQYNIVDFQSGRTFSCRSCGRDLVVPDPDETAPLDPVSVVLDQGSTPGGEASDEKTWRASSSGSGEIDAETFGNYRILKQIARGGMGIVYQAVQKGLDRVVALKVLSAGAGASREEVERFRLEATAAANLNHLYIVPIHDVGEVDGRHYFTMDFVEGRTLRLILTKGGLPIRDALIITRKVAEGLHHAHSKGIVHRDIKPANIIVDYFENPRITDFGIVKDLLADNKMTKTGELVGTPSYMSPEQAAGLKDIDGRADVYGLGAVLYELLTSRPPFQGEQSVEVLMKVVRDDPVPPRALNPAIHRDVETICLKCLQKDPARRYASAEELQKDIERYLNGETILARPVGWWEKAWRKVMRNKRVSATIAATFLTAFAISSYAIALKVNADRLKQKTVQGYVDHASGYLIGGNLVAALQEYSKALTIDPDDHDAQAGYAEAHRASAARQSSLIGEGNRSMRWEDYVGAQQRFEDALKLNDKNEEARDGLERVVEFLVEEGKTDELKKEADELLRSALDLVAEAKEATPERARGRYVEAVILLRQAVAKDPTEDRRKSEARQVLFETLLDFSELAIGRRTFDMASFLLSEASLLDGDRERLQSLQETLARRTREHKGYTQFLDQAREYLAAGDYDSAIPAVQQAVEIAETVEAKLLISQARYQKGIAEGDAKADERKWDEALLSYRTAMENASAADQKVAEAKFTRAQSEVTAPLLAEAKKLWEKGEAEEASAALRKLLEANPLHRLAHRMLADLERTEQAPEGTVYVPGGVFALSSDLTGHKQFIVSFYVARYEVTNGRFAEFVAAGGYGMSELWDPRGWDQIAEFTSEDGSPGPLGWTAGAFPEGLADHPVSGLSWYEARAYARWRKARLPTEWEWEKAASGGKESRRKYPWGDAWDSSLAHLDGGPPRPVGENESDESPFGVRDLGGNVSEWVVGDGSAPVIKGGSSLLPLERYARCSFRGIPPATYRSAATGFRCVRDVVGRQE